MQLEKLTWYDLRAHNGAIYEAMFIGRNHAGKYEFEFNDPMEGREFSPIYWRIIPFDKEELDKILVRETYAKQFIRLCI